MKDQTKQISIDSNMADIRSEIKKEDKQSSGKFILIMLLASIGGGIFGMFLVYSAKNKEAFNNFAELLSNTLRNASPYLVFLFALINALIVFLFYHQTRKLYATWEEEDEETLRKIENKLTIALMSISMESILFFLCTMIWFSGFTDAIENESLQNLLLKTGFYLAGFFVMLISQTLGQQKLVNLEKEINPEKRGSIYDFKFQKKWLESCDEAQKMMIYQAGYASYQIVNKLCMILMLCNMAGIILWDWGMIPAFMIAIIWSVSLLSYTIKASKLQN